MNCKVTGCERIGDRARGYCGMHYNRVLRYGDAGEAESRRTSYRETGVDWTNPLEVKKYRDDYIKRYRTKLRKTDPDALKSIGGMHEIRFGGLRERVLQRDNFTCQICGMTNEEHKEEWGVSITVDHLDGNGRYSNTPKHSMDNLWTLCLRCHGRRDFYRWWLSKGKPVSVELVDTLRL